MASSSVKTSAQSGTTIATALTSSVLINQAAQNPVLVTSTGSVITTGLYAIDDTVNAADAMTNNGSLSGNYGVFADGAGSSVQNFGSIVGTVGYGIRFNSNGTIVNGSRTNTSASIKGSSIAISILPGAAGTTSTITNYGTISGEISVATVQVANYGTITTTNLAGILAGAGSTVNNLGSITARAYSIELGSGGTVTNGSATDVTATITAADAGIFFGGADAGTVTNFGSIKGTGAGGYGIEASGAGRITIINGGAADTGATISGGFEGIGTAGFTTLTNYGAIVGTNAGVFLGGGGSVINGSASDKAASITGGVSITTGTTPAVLTNFGSISGGVSLSGTGVTVVNGSTTDRTASITGGTGTDGISVGSGTITNYGTISANTGISATGTVINAGTIASTAGVNGAAIGFGTGTSTLLEQPGALLIGKVYGFAATTIEFASGATGSPSGVSGIGKIVVDAGATDTVPSAEAVPNVVDNGTIAITAGGSLDVSSAVDPASSGLFQLTTKASLEIGAILGSAAKIQFLGSAHANTLSIDSAASFGLHVGTTSYAGPLLENFSAGDSIDIKGLADIGLTASYSAATGDLQITKGGVGVASLAFQNATLGAGAFHIGTDFTGAGTLITHS